MCVFREHGRVSPTFYLGDQGRLPRRRLLRWVLKAKEELAREMRAGWGAVVQAERTGGGLVCALRCHKSKRWNQTSEVFKLY